MDSFDIPPGAAARVCIIDTTMRIYGMPTDLLLKPSVGGFEKFPPLGTWSFLVESSTGRKVLFDLGCHCDSKTRAPLIQNQITMINGSVEVKANVADIIKEHGLSPDRIESVVWSHWHFDHVGDMTTFPVSTELVVGPGFKKAYFPGYPTHPDSHILESYSRDRDVREITFEGHNSIHIGAFRAFDFFGDGSFYLLDTPGHCTGHMSGLARTTTNPDTFIFMGGDLSHHGGEMRPSKGLPIPDILRFASTSKRPAAAFTGAQFRQINTRRGRQENEPFFDPVLADDAAVATETIKGAQAADARDDVFMILAHDMTIEGIIELFPQSANEWKKKGWKKESMWSFLIDLAAEIS